MDPLEFRLVNYAETEPVTGKPFSSKSLRECYAEGAKRFGWAGRPLAPRRCATTNGFLVGWGMGTAVFPCPHFPAEARATLRADGTALVETAGADMGQGAWTALPQIAAEALGLDPDQVEFHSGPPPAGRRRRRRLRAIPRAPVSRCITPARTRSRSSPNWPPPIPPRPSSAPAMSASSPARGRLHRRDDETRSEAMRTSSRAPAGSS